MEKRIASLSGSLVCVQEVYILATESLRVPICSSVHSWWLCSTDTPGNKAASPMTQCPIQTYLPSSSTDLSILVLSRYPSDLLKQEPNSCLPACETHFLLIWPLCKVCHNVTISDIVTKDAAGTWN